MVLEYIHGETLAARLSREQRLSEEALLRLLEEVLSGLTDIHEAGYVHRDIKPGNLMLRRRTAVRCYWTSAPRARRWASAQNPSPAS